MNNEKRNRQSIRLKDYDYAKAGAYFVTICTKDRACLFGRIVDEEMIPNDAGRIVTECWREIPQHFMQADLDEFIVMPNHIHGIICITDDAGATHASPASEPARQSGPIRHSIGAIIGSFKAAVSKRLNALPGSISGDACVAPTQGTTASAQSLWQRNYYEHVIRNEVSLNRIRQYIVDNPRQWALDQENPESDAFARAGHASFVPRIFVGATHVSPAE